MILIIKSIKLLSHCLNSISLSDTYTTLKKLPLLSNYSHFVKKKKLPQILPKCVVYTFLMLMRC